MVVSATFMEPILTRNQDERHRVQRFLLNTEEAVRVWMYVALNA